MEAIEQELANKSIERVKQVVVEPKPDLAAWLNIALLAAVVPFVARFPIPNVPKAPRPPPTAAPAPAPQPTPEATPHLPVAETETQHVVDIFAGIDPNQMRIMRQSTLKCASWMMVPLMKDFSSPLLAVKRTEELSELFMEYVVTGKIYEDIPEDAEDLLNEEF